MIHYHLRIKKINMSVYLVTWDLNKEKSGYHTARENFLNNLKTFEHTKDPGLDSVYFVSTEWSADEVSDDLRSEMDKNDKIVVVKLLKGNHQGWLNSEVWDWVNSRI